MTVRLLLSGALASACLSAQLQLYLVDGTTERAVAGVYDSGAVDAGNAKDTVFRVRNVGPAPTLVQTVTAAGTGFSVVKLPSMPVALVRGAGMDFTVRFQPPDYGSYNATLSVNSVKAAVLLGNCPPSATVSLLDGSTSRILSASVPVEFGSVEPGSHSTRKFVLANGTSLTVEIAALGVTGGAFQGPLGLKAPVRLAPGESVFFEIVFAPASGGAHEGELQVGLRRFVLRGAGIEPPLPPARIAVEAPTVASAQQVKVMVRLSEAARRNGAGQLSLDFSPAVAGAGPDPAIQFLSPSGSTVPFSVRQGEDLARFGDRTYVEIQTGTTAGRITLSARLEDSSDTLMLDIAPAVVGFGSATGTRAAQALEVRISAFDNTRSASQIAFAFYDTAGGEVAPGILRVDGTAAFRQYFASSGAGGLFCLTAFFPVTGDASRIAAFEAEIVNAQGSVRTGKVPFR